MKKIKWIKKGLLSCVNVLALMLVAQTANSACVWVLHQPKFPEEAKRFKKKGK